jgi:hypothetical protein
MTKPTAHSNKFHATVDTPTIYELLDNHRPVGCVREIVTADQFDNMWEFESYVFDKVAIGFKTAQAAMDALVKEHEADSY